MRAVILAAGRGSRLGELGADRPKCLVELCGHPLLERQLAALQHGGASPIGIVRGYRAEMLRPPGVTCFDNPRWAETNMVMSLVAARAWLQEDTVIVSYGDIFYPASLVAALVASPGSLVITYDRDWSALWSRRFADPLADAETFRIDATGTLLEIGGRTGRMQDIQGQYMGLLKFTPAAWRAVEQLLDSLGPQACQRLDMTGMLSRLLAAGSVPVSTVATQGQWGEIDNPEDVALYEQMVRRGELVLEPLGLESR
ncbi:MAG TPA: phosphocholine cytidylyltransferase family protein [Steroidobacteraceae bacterium]|nr:phosphocholine cytidylyltransferase family protein [Steroidobacteraceae bacterium]